MKKFFYLVILCLLFFNYSYSQFSVGVKTSAGASNVLSLLRNEIAILEQHRPLFAYSVGIYSGFLLKNKFEICTDVLYAVKRTEHNLMGDNITEKRNYKFISIPVYFNIGGQESLGLSFGIINNIFLSSNIKYSLENTYTLGALIGLHYKLSQKIKLTLEFQGDIKPFAEVENFFEIPTNGNLF